MEQRQEEYWKEYIVKENDKNMIKQFKRRSYGKVRFKKKKWRNLME